MGVRFVPVASFEAVVNGHNNSYLKGSVYTVHDTPQHRDLARRCEEWEAQGRIIVIGATDGRSTPGHIAQR